MNNDWKTTAWAIAGAVGFGVYTLAARFVDVDEAITLKVVEVIGAILTMLGLSMTGIEARDK